MEKIIYIVVKDCWDQITRISKIFQNKEDAEDYILDKYIDLYGGAPEKWNKNIENNIPFLKENNNALMEEFKLGYTPYSIEEHILF